MGFSEKAVTAITLNPCVDRTLTVERLCPGEHHAALRVQETVAGKGIDVNVALRHLDVPTLAVGFDFTQGGARVAAFLRAEGIPSRLHRIDAPLRVNTKIFEESSRQMTEINCKGPELSAEAENAFLRLLGGALPDTAILVACGSVPPGLSEGLYRTELERAARLGARTVLDAAGPLLREGLKARPDVIKPNLRELEALLGARLSTRAECIAACRKLTAEGAGAVCLTMGRDGALMVTQEEAWFSAGVPVDVRGVQGAGDSVVAGICAAMLRTDDKREWLRSGVAAAHASLIREGTLLCEKADFERFLPQIPVCEAITE